MRHGVAYLIGYALGLALGLLCVVSVLFLVVTLLRAVAITLGAAS